ncbi:MULTISPECIES: PelD GGDEF domain-containing protein [Ralstonia]|uniref:PelD GGDEF domain-containing protein n=1 Tax=Ralstonia wenshanensis TaxID=2842456 RepID=UPI0021B27903|nr:PelD GGDEF domain-containing protein [Ralstonia wenshanensis]MCT7305785.1 PelD GGDEF domain-containing protein [Ralstonia wenshanensis]
MKTESAGSAQSAGRAAADARGQGGRTERRRNAQGIGASTWYGRLIAPAVSSPSAVLETLGAVVVAIGVVWLFSPDNPLLLGYGFPWIWLVPLILALRYGTLLGALAALVVLGAWAVFYGQTAAAGSFPRMYFLGGLMLVLVGGQYGDIWGARLSRARTVNGYLNDRLAALTKNHFLLRLSHERLENDLLAKPTTLRDTLTQLRNIALAAREHGTAENAPDVAQLPGAEPFLQWTAQACQLEVAAMVRVTGNRIDTEPVARVGTPFDIVADDPLIRHCIDTHTLGHPQAPELRNVNNPEDSSRYVACAPVLSGADELIGLVVVHQMPFLSLSYENLQFLLVLLGYYADGVRHLTVSSEILDLVPDAPYEFALDLGRLARLHRDTGIDSSVVALIFHQDEASDALFESVVRSRRALDVVWQASGKNRRAIITLMPLSGAGAVSAYLVRIEDSLRAQFGVDFEGGHISVQTLHVTGEHPGEALQRFLARCHLDA